MHRSIATETDYSKQNSSIAIASIDLIRYAECP